MRPNDRTATEFPASRPHALVDIIWVDADRKIGESPRMSRQMPMSRNRGVTGRDIVSQILFGIRHFLANTSVLSVTAFNPGRCKNSINRADPLR